MKHLLFAGLLLAAALVTAAGAPGSPTQASETLQLNAALTPTWQFGDYCEPGTPTGFECVRFLGEANVPGLGRVTVTYVKVLGDDPNCPVAQFKTAVIRVAGKGDINLSLPRVVCGPTAPAGVGPLEIAIAGGTGMYAGASGSVQFKSFVYAGDFGCGPCGKASDTWTGTLTVPGLDFDVTAPRLVGAISKTVRAPKNAARVRVRYALSATDAVDGAVRVACTPRSGSFFKVGRTKVTCSATDSSGNTGRARFTITVKRS